MKIKLREDLAPDPDFYYHQQFKIYHEPYLIWDKETWEMALSACSVYQIEADGRYAGDLLLEDQRKGTKDILDFSLLPEYQGKGFGKAVVVPIPINSSTCSEGNRPLVPIHSVHLFRFKESSRSERSDAG
jgi:GNAT superfamily N-acetyltransferase